MSDDSKSALVRAFDKWFGFPDGSEKEDDIWHDFHIFDGHWIQIQNRREWYESPNVPSIYGDHKNIMKSNMGMSRPEENFFKQNIDDGGFASEMHAIEGLPSGSEGQLKIETNIGTKNPPSGDNDFCMVEYKVNTYIKYNVPGGIKFLPRILAIPINRFFKWAYLNQIAEEMVEYDGEYARERTAEYMQYIRKYHGEEPTQTRTRQAVYKPSFEDGVFFQ